MSFNWIEFLNIAKKLGVNPPLNINKEAAIRTSVSRAYYAAYNHSSEYAKIKLSFKPNNSSRDHKNLQTWLEKKNRLPEVRRLKQLAQWRKGCDYKKDFVISDLLYTKSIETAEKVILSLNIK